MIKLIEKGIYALIETKGQTKILTLDGNRTFAWVSLAEIGEILVASHKSHKVDYMLATGRYRTYEVKDEPKLTDLVHLELLVGDGIWQGYLLPTGLPTEEKKRNRIIPTNETITRSTH
ncbi:MAG: hypothetical protein HY430_02555 [Candidatus Levybacteria bacterium]|nr:hypothetical protein [Candidatus Levybacteria bacterium]